IVISYFTLTLSVLRFHDGCGKAATCTYTFWRYIHVAAFHEPYPRYATTVACVSFITSQTLEPTGYTTVPARTRRFGSCDRTSAVCNHVADQRCQLLLRRFITQHCATKVCSLVTVSTQMIQVLDASKL